MALWAKEDVTTNSNGILSSHSYRNIVYCEKAQSVSYDYYNLYIKQHIKAAKKKSH